MPGPVTKKGGAGGGKKKRRGQKGGGGAATVERGLLKSDGPQQQYAQALKMLGDRRILANVYDKSTQSWKEHMIRVRGKFRKRVYVNINDFVLVTTRDFESGDLSGDDRDDNEDGENGGNVDPVSKLPHGGDIIHVYNPTEVRKLAKMGEFIIRDDLQLNEGPHGARPQNRKGKLAFMDSDDENEESDEVIEPNAPAADPATQTSLRQQASTATTNETDGKRNKNKIAPQTRCLDMPDSESDSMDEEDLQQALKNL